MPVMSFNPLRSICPHLSLRSRFAKYLCSSNWSFTSINSTSTITISINQINPCFSGPCFFTAVIFVTNMICWRRANCSRAPLDGCPALQNQDIKPGLPKSTPALQALVTSEAPNPDDTSKTRREKRSKKRQNKFDEATPLSMRKSMSALACTMASSLHR